MLIFSVFIYVSLYHQDLNNCSFFFSYYVIAPFLVIDVKKYIDIVPLVIRLAECERDAWNSTSKKYPAKTVFHRDFLSPILRDTTFFQLSQVF